MGRAFISHSSKDKPFVRKLKEDLNFNDIDTWVDEDELKPGDKLYDTLILSLQTSSYFLVVLSNNIKNSYWVDTEINEAISSLDKSIIKKIIPILLRKTHIPDALKGLLYADFSEIIFTLTENGKVSFTGAKYTSELEKIVKAIKQSKDYILTQTEIENIVKKVDTSTTSKHITKTVGLYEIVGFANNASRSSYIENMKVKNKASAFAKMATNKIVPIVLPSLLRALFSKLKLGDKLNFKLGEGDTIVSGHFCGFSSNNTRIILPSEIRRAFGIKPKDILNVSFDSDENLITLISSRRKYNS